MEIRGDVELPARRENIELHTDDGLTLVGEIALPLERDPVATLVTLHPLPTHGGFMDSHIYRKAARRLPALADIAVLRFNTRGTESPRGKSEGVWDRGEGEGRDLRAAMDFVRDRGLQHPWVLGWSFGTDVALKHALDEPVDGVILLSPPLRYTTEEELWRWASFTGVAVAYVPEHDDFLPPDKARQRFAIAPSIDVVPVAGAKHLWVGEKYSRYILNGIVEHIHPAAAPLPTEWPDAGGR